MLPIHLLAILTLLPARVQTAPPIPTAQELAATRTADLLAEGKEWLKKGKRFPTAIALFQEVARREPKAAASSVYLGCATAARAYSLADYATRRKAFPAEQKRYDTLYKQWETIRKKPDLPPFFFPAPPAPLLPRTTDGNEVLPATDSELREQVKTLTTKALAALASADELLKSEPDSDTTVELRNIEAWSAVLLSVAPCQFTGDQKAYAAATALARTSEDAALAVRPRSVAQGLSVSDTLILLGTHPLAPNEKGDAKTTQAGFNQLLRVVEKAPDPGAVWYWMILNLPDTPESDEKRTPYMHNALLANPGNTLFNYMYAAAFSTDALFEEFKQYNKTTAKVPMDREKMRRCTEESLRYLRIGNSGSGVVPFVYPVHCPSVVRWAFKNYRPTNFLANFMLGFIGSDLGSDTTKKRTATETLSLLHDREKMAMQFFQGMENPDISLPAYTELFGIGWSLMSGVGQGSYTLQYSEKDRSIGKELDYTHEFVIERRRQMWEKFITSKLAE